MAISSMLVPVRRTTSATRWSCATPAACRSQSVHDGRSSATAVELRGSRRRSSRPGSTARASGSRRWPSTRWSAARMDDRAARRRPATRAQAILALAEQADVDVICCGTDGQVGRRRRCSSGSVSERLVRSGTVRTMTVRFDLLEAAEDPRDLARDFARRLVVPTDFSASASRALLSAVERPAEAIDDHSHVIHVSAGDARPRTSGSSAEVMLQGLRGHRARARRRVRVRAAIGRGDPVDAVLDYLDERRRHRRHHRAQAAAGRLARRCSAGCR